jgi:hypothetical protein
LFNSVFLLLHLYTTIEMNDIAFYFRLTFESIFSTSSHQLTVVIKTIARIILETKINIIYNYTYFVFIFKVFVQIIKQIYMHFNIISMMTEKMVSFVVLYNSCQRSLHRSKRYSFLIKLCFYHTFF